MSFYTVSQYMMGFIALVIIYSVGIYVGRDIEKNSMFHNSDGNLIKNLSIAGVCVFGSGLLVTIFIFIYFK